jgi:formylglycine-generating enzyme
MRGVITILIFLSSAGCLIAQEAFKNTIGMEFILIKPGKFTVGKFHPPYPVPDDTIKGAKRPVNMWMGDGRRHNQKEFDEAKRLALKDRSDGFVVSIDNEYFIGKFEVTQEQWHRVMGDNPSTFKHIDSTANFPVESITWNDAQKFVKRLNKLEKTKKYRLPTEFEWEYAARAGTENDIPWSEIIAMAQLGKKETQMVGQKKPNAWGLYDMLGNVWEWVADCYNEKIFADPTPPEKGEQHVLKGASISGDVKNATYMTHAGGPGNGWDVGLRIIMTTDK